MFNFFFYDKKDAYNKNKFVFSSCPNYHGLVPTILEKTWKGRAINLLFAFLKTIPLLGPIVELSIQIFLVKNSKAAVSTEKSLYPSHKIKQSKDSFISSPRLDQMDSKKKIKSPFIDPKVSLEDDLDPKVSLEDELDPKVSLEDDLKYASELQAQLFCEDFEEGVVLDSKDLSKEESLEDDEEIARQLQEELFSQDVVVPKTLQPFLNSKDEKIGKKLPGQLLSEDVISEKICSDASFSDPSQEIASEVKEATFQILSTPGLRMVKQKNGDPPVYKFLKKKLREVIAFETKKFPQAMNPVALKTQRDVNLEQYLALKFKRFGHAHELKGVVKLPSGHRIKLEGFFEVFVVPMIISSFETFALTSKFFSDHDKKWIISQFNQIIFTDYILPKDVESFVVSLQTSGFVGPLLMQTGYDEHSAVAIWFGPFLLFVDRQGGDKGPGIYVFYLPNRELINDQFVDEIIKCNDIKEKDYLFFERILSEFNGICVHYEHMAAQTAAICTYATMQGVLLALMSFTQALNSGKDLEKIDQEKWKEFFQAVRQEHLKWLNYDREMLSQDLIDEIEEWLDHKNDFGKLNLKETYQDVLTAWLNKGLQNKDSKVINKVQILLEKLEKDKAP
jgi:hypothetical protein